jgi:D-alanine-D-alanine ligase
MMLNIIVLLGGNSPERKVSLVSGREITAQLKQNGHQVTTIDPADFSFCHEMIKTIHDLKPDLVFIGLHGGEGENGILQATLTASKILFTGSHFKASAVAMDKLLSKHIAVHAQVPVPKYQIVNLGQYEQKQLSGFSEYKSVLSGNNSSSELVIKPADAGSSVGVHIVTDELQFETALSDAFLYSDKVIIEEYIEGRELTVTILDGAALPVVEIMPHEGFYDYPNKYTEGNTTYQAPAELTPLEATTIQKQAMKIWQAMECSGYARIDFRYNGKVFYFLEVNTLPGMTPLSLTPMAAKANGIDFGALLERIMDVALTSKS